MAQSAAGHQARQGTNTMVTPSTPTQQSLHSGGYRRMFSGWGRTSRGQAGNHTLALLRSITKKLFKLEASALHYTNWKYLLLCKHQRNSRVSRIPSRTYFWPDYCAPGTTQFLSRETKFIRYRWLQRRASTETQRRVDCTSEDIATRKLK